MPLSDIQLRLTGGSSNTNPNLSLGGVRSSTQVGVGANNLWDNIDANDSLSGDTEYRAIAIYNSGVGTFSNVGIWFDNSGDGITELTLWSEGINPGTPQTVANENTSPTGASWTKPLESSPLNISNLTAGSEIRLWLRRVTNATLQSATGITPILTITAS